MFFSNIITRTLRKLALFVVVSFMQALKNDENILHLGTYVLFQVRTYKREV